MAIYHCSVKTIGRSAGRSATASAAYRAADKIKDERTGEIHDYTKKQGIEHSEIILPYNGKMERARLWNLAEKSEKRKNSTVAREYEVALPDELTSGQRKKLTLEFARHLTEQYNVAADVSIHVPGKGGDLRNYHAHILTTTRQVTPDGFGAKTRVLDDKKTGEIEQIRKIWAQLTNNALERAGHNERVSHQSLKAQGLEREPTIHIGVAAAAMERRGIKTERGDHNREIENTKHTRQEINRTLCLHTGVTSVWQKYYDDKLAKEYKQAEERKLQERLDKEQAFKRKLNKSRGISR